MNLELDFRSGLPIYMQVVDRIKEMIANGKLNPGDQLPTVRALAQELRVNFNTVARAYRILDESHIISTQQGRGTYILELPPPEVSAGIRERSLEALNLRYLADAERIGVPQEQLTASLQRAIEKSNEERSSAEHETQKKENGK